MTEGANRGVAYAALAYIFWGLFPIYFKAVAAVPAFQTLAHRVVWSLVCIALLLAVLKRWAWLGALRSQPRTLLAFAASAACITINWAVFIWAVNAGRVVDASLGYFITPLMNVAIGALLLRERLTPGQWLAVALAALGVVWLTAAAGHLPWIGLTLALSFATYGLLRKIARLGAIEGLALETALMAPVALAYLGWLAYTGENRFIMGDSSLKALLMLAGPVTAIPLLLFAAGARRIPLATLGLLQYLAPSLQLLIGIWLFHEPFEPAKAAGYVCIWAALAVFSAEGLWRWQRR